jgi:DNA adenine methylase
MKYMGSKARIAKYILPIMLATVAEKNITTWIEPFVGGGNTIDKVPSNLIRIGIDYNPHTIAAMVAVRDRLSELPETLTKEEYDSLRGTSPEPISSWIRFVASFGGKFENGFARQGNPLKYRSEPIVEGKRNAQKQSPLLQGVTFIHGSYAYYDKEDFDNCLIYCDPPYQNSTSYKTDKFDHEHFWQWAREMSGNNSVFVSEYIAPEDFTCVWSGEVKTNFASQRSKPTHLAIEKLFTLEQC